MNVHICFPSPLSHVDTDTDMQAEAEAEAETDRPTQLGPRPHTAHTAAVAVSEASYELALRALRKTYRYRSICAHGNWRAR
eukprot:6204807-Pleurochrysis_carterae.AAC.4